MLQEGIKIDTGLAVITVINVHLTKLPNANVPFIYFFLFCVVLYKFKIHKYNLDFHNKALYGIKFLNTLQYVVDFINLYV